MSEFHPNFFLRVSRAERRGAGMARNLTLSLDETNGHELLDGIYYHPAVSGVRLGDSQVD